MPVAQLRRRQRRRPHGSDAGFLRHRGRGGPEPRPARSRSRPVAVDEGRSLHYGGHPCAMDEVLALGGRPRLLGRGGCGPRAGAILGRACGSMARSAASASSRTRTCRSAREACWSRTTTSSPSASGCPVARDDDADLGPASRTRALYDVVTHGFNYRLDEIRAAMALRAASAAGRGQRGENAASSSATGSCWTASRGLYAVRPAAFGRFVLPPPRRRAVLRTFLAARCARRWRGGSRRASTTRRSTCSPPSASFRRPLPRTDACRADPHAAALSAPDRRAGRAGRRGARVGSSRFQSRDGAAG